MANEKLLYISYLLSFPATVNFVNRRVNFRVSCCSSKTIVALKTQGNYTGLGQSPTSSLREGSEFVFLGSSALRTYNGVCNLRDSR